MRARLGGMRSWIPTITAGCMLASAPPAGACSCTGFTPERLDITDAAVVGEVVEVDASTLLQHRKVTHVRVERSLDDEIERGSTIEVTSGSGGGDCGLELDVGERAGLLLREVDGRWHGSLCDTTTAARLSLELDRRDPPSGTLRVIAAYANALVVWIQEAPIRSYLSSPARDEVGMVVRQPPCVQLRRA